MNKQVSVIIVKYRSEQYLTKCIASINDQNPREIIVIDNDANNIGYGSACNQGAKKASGEYLLFVNPDTLLLPNCLKIMAEFLSDNNKAGIIGPKLYTSENKNLVQLSCCRKPDILGAIIVYGKVNRLWPNNPWWNHFTYKKYINQKELAVDVVSGAVIMVKRSVFNALHGFDENYFLYFEENDLCIRAKTHGYQTYYLPVAEAVHFGQGSTTPGMAMDRAFITSRHRFIKQHYPKLSALLINRLC